MCMIPKQQGTSDPYNILLNTQNKTNIIISCDRQTDRQTDGWLDGYMNKWDGQIRINLFKGNKTVFHLYLIT